MFRSPVTVVNERRTSRRQIAAVKAASSSCVVGSGPEFSSSSFREESVISKHLALIHVFYGREFPWYAWSDVLKVFVFAGDYGLSSGADCAEFRSCVFLPHWVWVAGTVRRCSLRSGCWRNADETFQENSTSEVLLPLSNLAAESDITIHGPCYITAIKFAFGLCFPLHVYNTTLYVRSNSTGLRWFLFGFSVLGLVWCVSRASVEAGCSGIQRGVFCLFHATPESYFRTLQWVLHQPLAVVNGVINYPSVLDRIWEYTKTTLVFSHFNLAPFWQPAGVFCCDLFVSLSGFVPSPHFTRDAGRPPRTRKWEMESSHSWLSLLRIDSVTTQLFYLNLSLWSILPVEGSLTMWTLPLLFFYSNVSKPWLIRQPRSRCKVQPVKVWSKLIWFSDLGGHEIILYDWNHWELNVRKRIQGRSCKQVTAPYALLQAFEKLGEDAGGEATCCTRIPVWWRT